MPKTDDEAKREHLKTCLNPKFNHIELESGFLLTCEKHPEWCEVVEPSACILLALADHVGIKVTLLPDGHLKVETKSQPNSEQRRHMNQLKKYKSKIIGHMMEGI